MAVLGEADVNLGHEVGVKRGAADREYDHRGQEPEAGKAGTSDRRRPGRVQVTNPHLIPVLRGAPDMADDSSPEQEPSPRELQRDDLSAAHGLMVGLLLAIPIWCAIILGVSRILR